MLPTGSAKVTCVVNNGPAGSAGLKAGDVITEFNGKPIADYGALTSAIAAQKPGDKVTLTVTSRGSTQHVTVMLGSRPAGATTNNCSKP